MKLNRESLEERDIASQLHSYTDAIAHERQGPFIVDRGEGIHVFDTHGRQYIEGMAGLWSVAVGFSEERLIKAAMAQMAKLPYYHTFSHKSHAPSIQLAEKLIDIAPVPMSKVYFTNSGSEANDTVMKLIWYRSNVLGQPQRKKIISRTRSYHGVTIGSASLTGLPNNHRYFDLPLDQVIHVSCPHFWREGLADESEDEFSTRLATELEQTILREGPETVAAFIGEPIMGAGGVIVPPLRYWSKVQEVLRKYDILLVADEVICGFGRTGQMFGCDTFNIKPDIIVLSKQLSSSYAPIAAVLMNDDVYGPIADLSHQIGVLGHGFTGSGHPVSAAVALENIRIIEDDALLENAVLSGEVLQSRLRLLQGHPLVAEVRGIGLLGAVELSLDKGSRAPKVPVGKLGTLMNNRLQHNGVISRSINDAAALCPPLIISRPQVDDLMNRFEAALREVSETIDVQ